MPRITRTREFISDSPHRAREIYQYVQFVDLFTVGNDPNAPQDLTGKSISFIAEFFTTSNPNIALSPSGSTVVISDAIPHETLHPRELSFVEADSDLANGVVAVQIPENLWTDEIAYGETLAVPLVILNLVVETLDHTGAAATDRSIEKRFYLVRPARVDPTNLPVPALERNRLLPSGGELGQSLAKRSDNDYDVEWSTATGGVLNNQRASRDTLGKLVINNGSDGELTEFGVVHEGTPHQVTFGGFVDPRFIGYLTSDPDPSDYAVERWYFNPISHRARVVTDIDPLEAGEQKGFIDAVLTELVAGDEIYAGAFATDALAAPHVTKVGDMFFNTTYRSLRVVTVFVAGSDAIRGYKFNRIATDKDLVLLQDQIDDSLDHVLYVSPRFVDKNSIPDTFYVELILRDDLYRTAAKLKIDFLGQSAVQAINPENAILANFQPNAATIAAIGGLAEGGNVDFVVKLLEADDTELVAYTAQLAVTQSTGGGDSYATDAELEHCLLYTSPSPRDS